MEMKTPETASSETALPIKLWTVEEEKQLIEMWELGCSAREIGLKLGVGRNSILGKIKRLRDNGVAKMGLRQSPMRTKMGLRQSRIAEDPKGCRYIHGNPCGADTKWCGEKLRPGTFWCEEHYRKCYRPKPTAEEGNQINA